MKNTCSSKDLINRMKRQAPHWRKMFTIHKSDKVIVARIDKKLLTLNNKKTNNPTGHLKVCDGFVIM